MFGRKKKTEATSDLDPTLARALGNVDDPELHKDLVTLGMAKKAVLDGDVARITIELTTPACPLKDTIRKDIEAAVLAERPGTSVEIEWTAQVSRGRHGGVAGSQEPFPSLEQVRNVILVASGKGGVGKSTVATNLATALARTGSRVGLMDADIYGPSIPTMLDAHEQVFSKDGKTIEPIEKYGMKLMSIGFFMPPEQATIWRGPMVHGAITQFLKDVQWGELDYLVVDMPPGTGDAQLTMAQALKVTGAVIVSTPQEVALADVIRANAMFDKVKVPILGLVENMSYFVCDGCDKRHHLFDHGGARAAAEKLGIEFLAELPLVPAVRDAGDRGMPIVEAEPESPAAQAFVALAQKVAGIVSVLNVETAAKAEADGPSKAARRSLPVIG